MLCKEVGGVDVAEDFAKVHPARPYRLLDPQSVGIQMSQFPQTLPAADPNGGRRIRPYSQGQVLSEVAQEALVAQPYACAANNSVELGLATAQGDA